MSLINVNFDIRIPLNGNKLGFFSKILPIAVIWSADTKRDEKKLVSFIFSIKIC